MKKLVLFIFAFLMPMALFAGAVLVDGIYYNLNGATAEVTYCPSRDSEYHFYEGDIVIPKGIRYDGVEYDVTKIGRSAFGGCEKIKSISIIINFLSILHRQITY